ncbi:MAG: efflux RND transporter permease subunit [Sulfuricaulis sp.]
MPPAAARPAAAYRLLCVLSTLTILLLGFLALGRLPVDILPARDAPHLRVQVAVPGLSAPVIDAKIARPLETALTGAAGVTAVESVITPGRATVNLYLQNPTKLDAARQDVIARLDHVRPTWPSSIDAPVVSVVDSSSDVMEFALTSKQQDMLALRDWADNVFANKLHELPGVADVRVEGGELREILVSPDQRRLAGYGLSFGDVLQAVRKTPEADAGTRAPPIKGRARREPIQSGNAAAVAAMPVALPSGESIPLSEVTRITLRQEASPGSFHFENEPAVKVIVRKLPSAALSDVVERIHAHIEWMRANRLVPDGIEIHALSHRIDQARKTVRQIAVALIGGVLLALIVAFLTWGEGRRTLILGAIVVTSLQAVFIAMASLKLALDVVTLGGLAFGAGLFGAGAILVFGNKARYARGDAASLRPIMAAAIAVPLAPVPILFIGGEIGASFQEFVPVFCGAWLVSVLLALLLVPAFDARVRRHEKSSWKAPIARAISRAHPFYSGLLRYILRRPAVVSILALLFAGGVTYLFLHQPQGFPPADIRDAGDIVLRIQGPDSERLARLGNDITQRLRAVPQLRDVKNSAQARSVQLVPDMDADRASALGIDVADVGQALAIALDGIPAGSFRDAEHQYDIRVQLPPEDTVNDAALGKILLLGELSDRPAVRLRDVATLARIDTPDRILRFDGMPMIELSAALANGAVSSQTMTRLRALFDRYTLPAGYRFFYGGIGKAAEQSQSQGLTALGWSLLLLFIAQVLAQASLLKATLVTFTAYFALTGVGAAVLIFGMPLTPSVWMGALITVGIAAAYAAVLAAPMTAARTSIARAVRHRFRPLLVVTLLALAGMMPLLWVDRGATLLFPLVVIGATGVVFSLVASLLLLPALYILSARKEQNRSHSRL